MKKWLKRLTLLTVVLLLVLAGAGAWTYFYGVRGTPDWLRRPTASAAEEAAAASRLDRKIMETLSQASEMAAYNDPASRPADPNDKRPAASQPASKLALSFSEEELNASFQKWDKLFGWTERYRSYVKDPRVVIHDGKIILAGQSEELGTVVSLHFDPKLDKSGQLRLRLSDVLAGRVSLPQAFFEKYRTALRTKLQSVLPELQRRAEFKPDGSANSDAMSAAMAKLFLHTLADEPAEPVLFLPVRQARSVPVRLTDVKVEEKSLSMTVKPLTAPERVVLLEKIREPLDKQTARSSESTELTRRRETGS